MFVRIIRVLTRHARGLCGNYTLQDPPLIRPLRCGPKNKKMAELPDRALEKAEKLYKAQDSSDSQPTSSLSSASLASGYEVEFLERPPEALLQSECPVCLLVLREPYQVTCCGYSYCRACIEKVQSCNNPCPTCNGENFSTFPDKRLQRSLYGVHVRCTHQKDGCPWTGELGELSKHLNEDPKSGEHCLVGCDFAKIECIHCSEFFQRRFISNHQLKECPRRPFSCDYCGNYLSDYKDVTTSHWQACESYPVPCPNDCGMNPKRGDLDHHVKKGCPFAVVNCDFHFAGCEVRLPVKEMSAHLAKNIVAHMSLLAANEQRLMVEKDERISTLEGELREKLEEGRQKIDQLEMENRSLRSSLQELEQKVAEMSPQFPVDFTVDNFEVYRRTNRTWYSPPFYSHPNGYHLCLQVIGNYLSDGTDIAIGACLMRGKFDEFLKWPFRGGVAIEVQNQLEDKEHIKFLTFLSGPNAMRVTTSNERAEKGSERPVAYSKLDYNESSSCQYLKDNCLRLRVTRVTSLDWSEVEKKCRMIEARTSYPPVDFTMLNFQQHKMDGDIWVSPSFYTHPKGYRICLGVCANGYRDGEGSHISLYMYLLWGEFDNYLKWPFQGDATVQLLNQLEDKRHHEATVTPGSNVERPTTLYSATAGAGGGYHQFIAHRELGYNASKNCQYLKFDCLRFRVRTTKFIVKK